MTLKNILVVLMLSQYPFDSLVGQNESLDNTDKHNKVFLDFQFGESREIVNEKINNHIVQNKLKKMSPSSVLSHGQYYRYMYNLYINGNNRSLLMDFDFDEYDKLDKIIVSDGVAPNQQLSHTFIDLLTQKYGKPYNYEYDNAQEKNRYNNQDMVKGRKLGDSLTREEYWRVPYNKFIGYSWNNDVKIVLQVERIINEELQHNSYSHFQIIYEDNTKLLIDNTEDLIKDFYLNKNDEKSSQSNTTIVENDESLKYGDWTLDISNGGNRYITNGEYANGHLFGFYQLYGNCDMEILWLTWSTSVEGANNLIGTVATIQFEIDTVKFEINAAITQHSEFSPNLSLLGFTEFVVGIEFINALDYGEMITVSIISPEELVNSLDIHSDNFSLIGLGASRAHSFSVCKD